MAHHLPPKEAVIIVAVQELNRFRGFVGRSVADGLAPPGGRTDSENANLCPCRTNSENFKKQYFAFAVLFCAFTNATRLVATEAVLQPLRDAATGHSGHSHYRSRCNGTN
eukprot:1097702-Pleurochrysis_carterae.AAC.9